MGLVYQIIIASYSYAIDPTKYWYAKILFGASDADWIYGGIPTWVPRKGNDPWIVYIEFATPNHESDSKVKGSAAVMTHMAKCVPYSFPYKGSSCYIVLKVVGPKYYTCIYDAIHNSTCYRVCTDRNTRFMTMAHSIPCIYKPTESNTNRILRDM